MSTSTKTPASIRQGGPGASLMRMPRSRSTSISRRPTIRNAGTVKYPVAAESTTAIILITRKEKVAVPIQLRRTGHEHEACENEQADERRSRP